MDRRLVYTGSIPQDLDLNQNAEFAMVGLGFLAEAVMGMNSWAYGLAPSATSVPSLTINISRGALGQASTVDATNPGSSGIADAADALMKVGINLTSTSLTFVAPAGAGQSQVFLIEGNMQEADGGAAVLPYYNAHNPAQPFAGPNNSGASNNTLRTQRVALNVVSGSPAATGSQAAPAAATGWVPLYTVTLANGQTTISAAQVIQHPSAPFLPFNLPQLAPGSSRRQIFAANGNFIVPAGVYRLSLRMWAAGGSGGTSPAPAWPGGGAGGGGYTERYIAVTPGQVIAVTVGQGAPAAPGGASSFGTFATATGGTAGTNGTSNAVGLAGAGGLAYGGDLNLPGAPGSNGFNFGSTTVEGGRGGPSFGGGHTFAAGGTSAGFNANSGTFPGGGSSGCTNATAPGGNGLVVVEF